MTDLEQLLSTTGLVFMAQLLPRRSLFQFLCGNEKKPEGAPMDNWWFVTRRPNDITVSCVINVFQEKMRDNGNLNHGSVLGSTEPPIRTMASGPGLIQNQINEFVVMMN